MALLKESIAASEIKLPFRETFVVVVVVDCIQKPKWLWFVLSQVRMCQTAFAFEPGLRRRSDYLKWKHAIRVS